MITVEEARDVLLKNVVPMPATRSPVGMAAGRYTASTVLAQHDHPLFDQSAVDGYALHWDPSVSHWSVVAEVAAGDDPQCILKRGECARIYTGAELPAGADTVVMQERVTRNGTGIVHDDHALPQGANVRRQGEQFKIGTPILKAGTPISPQALGLLLSAGVCEVDLHERPRVAVVVTGDEFADPSTPAPGKIFNSNGAMVAAVLQREGLVCTVLHAPDDLEVLQVVLRDALAQHDLVITTGGVSVGDKDLVRPALEALGTEVLAHNVAQKPGKPMLIGRHKDCPVLGLPGNPRAVLVLCWEYVLPALRCMQGACRPLPRVDRLPLADALELSGKRAEFRAARVTGGRVQLLADQGSHMLASLLEADALAYFPIGIAGFEQGALVEVHYLP